MRKRLPINRAILLFRFFFQMSETYLRIEEAVGRDPLNYAGLDEDKPVQKSVFMKIAQDVAQLCGFITPSVGYAYWADVLCDDDEMYIRQLKDCLRTQNMKIDGDHFKTCYHIHGAMIDAYKGMKRKEEDISVERFIELFLEHMRVDKRHEYIMASREFMDSSIWNEGYGIFFRGEKWKKRKSSVHLVNNPLFDDRIIMTGNISHASLDDLEFHLERYYEYEKIRNDLIARNLKSDDDAIFCEWESVHSKEASIDQHFFDNSIAIVETVIENAGRGVFPGGYGP